MMTKNDILTLGYKLLVASPINALSGTISKTVRTTNSDLEDCVISLIPGTTAKHLQQGALQIKIYYVDLNENNTYIENSKRGGQLEQLLLDFSETLLTDINITFLVDTRETYTAPVPEIHQHYAILKINYLITNN